MIQRKQSIWLALAATISLLCFVLPYGLHQSTTEGSTSISDTILTAKSDIWSAVLVSISAFLSLIIIFLYKNRGLQMKLIMLNSLCYIGTAVYFYLNASNASLGNKIAIGLVGSQLYIGLLLPLLSSFLLALAFIGVKKDDELVKSVDRLR